MHIILFCFNIKSTNFSNGLGVGWVYHFFYLFISWSNRMTALFICYNSTALCTSKRDVSARAMSYLWRLISQFIVAQVSLHRFLLLRWSFLQPSFLCSLCCNMLTAQHSEVVGCGREYSLLWPSIFLCLFGSPLLWIGTTCA